MPQGRTQITESQLLFSSHCMHAKCLNIRQLRLCQKRLVRIPCPINDERRSTGESFSRSSFWSSSSWSSCVGKVVVSKFIGSGVLQRGLGEKTVSVRRGRGRESVVVFDGLRRLGCRASAKSFFQNFSIVASLREGSKTQRSVFVAVVVVSRCRRSGLRRLGRRVPAKSFVNISR